MRGIEGRDINHMFEQLGQKKCLHFILLVIALQKDSSDIARAAKIICYLVYYAKKLIALYVNVIFLNKRAYRTPRVVAHIFSYIMS